MTALLAPMRRHAWLAFVLGCLSVVALYYTWPGDADRGRDVIWLIMPIISVLAVGCGIALQRPQATGAWLGIALALFLTGVGDVLWELGLFAG